MTQTIHEWLQKNTLEFKKSGIKTARLDAMLLLCKVLSKNKVWILANPEHHLSMLQTYRLDRLAAKRRARVPTAYLLGHQEFYGYDFVVNKNVLIPRPETEDLVEQVAKLAGKKKAKIIDVGTGSGAIAIACKLQLPNTDISACDISPKALAVAKQNANKHNVKIKFVRSNLLAAFCGKFDIIAANLPYVDEVDLRKTWQQSPETSHEPPVAIFASNQGLSLINQLITDATHKLKLGGCLFLEADPKQHPAIVDFARSNGFTHVDTRGFIVSFSLDKPQA